MTRDHIDTVRLCGILAAALCLLVALLNARGLRCSVCWRGWSIFRDQRCWRHRVRRLPR